MRFPAKFEKNENKPPSATSISVENKKWSRRRESNPPKSAWEADAIPIGDACIFPFIISAFRSFVKEKIPVSAEERTNGMLFSPSFEGNILIKFLFCVIMIQDKFISKRKHIFISPRRCEFVGVYDCFFTRKYKEK